MERREDLRAGDADRQVVGDRLRDALNEGRLNLTEYDERLQQAYSAKTYGELDKVLHDLPPVTPVRQSQLATAASSTARPAGDARSSAQARPKGWLLGIWGGWLTASLVTTGIWFATGISGGRLYGFWPIWVIVPFGAVCLAQTIRSLSDPEHDLRARQQRRDRRNRRRYR